MASRNDEREYMVYVRIVKPTGMKYYGMTYDIKKRGKRYKSSALEDSIKEYGWDNIKTEIIASGLTRDEAERLEDRLISEGKKRGDCLNKNKSGGRTRDRIKYDHEQYMEHREEHYMVVRDWVNRHKDEVHDYMVKYNKGYFDAYNSSMPRRIYNAVHNYNKKHPDCIIMTPAEAKKMYEETGHVPGFINVDFEYKPQKRLNLALDECIEIAKQYKYAGEFARAHSGVYKILRKNGLLDGLFPNRKKRNKKVLQFTLNDELIKEWDNSSSAGKELGISSDCIRKCCNGKSESIGGFKWKYAE